MEIANSIGNAYYRALALGFVEVAQAQAEDIAGAIETTSSAQDLSYIAIAQVEAGDIEGADEALGSAIEAGRGRSWWVLSDIAIAQLKLGDSKSAKKTIISISDVFEVMSRIFRENVRP